MCLHKKSLNKIFICFASWRIHSFMLFVVDERKTIDSSPPWWKNDIWRHNKAVSATYRVEETYCVDMSSRLPVLLQLQRGFFYHVAHGYFKQFGSVTRYWEKLLVEKCSILLFVFFYRSLPSSFESAPLDDSSSEERILCILSLYSVSCPDRMIFIKIGDHRITKPRIQTDWPIKQFVDQPYNIPNWCWFGCKQVPAD